MKRKKMCLKYAFDYNNKKNIIHNHFPSYLANKSLKKFILLVLLLSQLSSSSSTLSSLLLFLSSSTPIYNAYQSNFATAITFPKKASEKMLPKRLRWETKNHLFSIFLFFFVVALVYREDITRWSDSTNTDIRGMMTKNQEKGREWKIHIKIELKLANLIPCAEKHENSSEQKTRTTQKELKWRNEQKKNIREFFFQAKPRPHNFLKKKRRERD